ncbi:MAG: hypothetical protein AAF429_04400 [Pseudomonadota bacterium]
MAQYDRLWTAKGPGFTSFFELTVPVSVYWVIKEEKLCTEKEQKPSEDGFYPIDPFWTPLNLPKSYEYIKSPANKGKYKKTMDAEGRKFIEKILDYFAGTDALDRIRKKK